ncbi:tetratricopeptide (TPR) repeat protein [Paraburkholderia terricola]|uniref:tetratricopeptide repeat protein n=1 Tax=Paraburkholderia terricola TaxID=169427 RepID=UPI002860C7E4|nr:tetratricopeptide repeat protein [Paraburkholderia terricola]MDR6496307.1 tetratricopeptide (TPR) repeat protein [Paraburkholderia terricola]
MSVPISAPRIQGDGGVRERLHHAVLAVIQTHQISVVGGVYGLGQLATILDAAKFLPDWEVIVEDGRWLAGGYLAGFHELVSRLITDCELRHPDLIRQHEQTLKRILPSRHSDAYCVPKDLTNTASRAERTRFYHHEYQNKLLVGLTEFVVCALEILNRRFILSIPNADGVSPTIRSLLDIFGRRGLACDRLKIVLIGGKTADSLTYARVEFPSCLPEEFEQSLGIASASPADVTTLYDLSHGNTWVAQGLHHCLESGVVPTGRMPPESLVDCFLASIGTADRIAWASTYIEDNFDGDFASARNFMTLPRSLLNGCSEQSHAAAMQRYREGTGPLALIHALSLCDKNRRAEALVEPCEILMEIGLYDTWFSFFLPIFNDPELRRYGDGNAPLNRLFVHAAFVLYAMGNTRAATPFLEDFMREFPHSQYVPTVLYAQSMIYGRYQIPADLPRAEACAALNLRIIDSEFKHCMRHKYIQVFAENAYAYIKARQGKFSEALDLCEVGNKKMLREYGDGEFSLHRSILIYNTSQIYEIIGALSQAEEKLKEAIACDPFYAEYHNDLGNLLSRLNGRPAESLHEYDEAIRLSPPYYEAHLNRGLLRAEIGNTMGAMTDFLRVLEIKPSEWRALKEIGNLQLISGDYRAAYATYQAALSTRPVDADLLANMGVACSELGDSAQAIAFYQQAVAAQPHQPDAHNNLAVEFFAMLRLEEALHHAELACACGNDPVYVSNRDAIRHLVGQTH